MNIVKLAQSGGTPSVRIKITFENGEMVQKVIEHLNGASCSTSNDQLILDDITNAVGGLGEANGGRTLEGFEEEAKKKGPQKAPSIKDAPFGTSPAEQDVQTKKDKKLLNWGV